MSAAVVVRLSVLESPCIKPLLTDQFVRSGTQWHGSVLCVYASSVLQRGYIDSYYLMERVLHHPTSGRPTLLLTSFLDTNLNHGHRQV